jgi:hypothetical protein
MSIALNSIGFVCKYCKYSLHRSDTEDASTEDALTEDALTEDALTEE